MLQLAPFVLASIHLQLMTIEEQKGAFGAEALVTIIKQNRDYSL